MKLSSRVFGWILLIVAILSSFQLITARVPHVITAFCYIGVFLAALGFLTNRPAIIYSYASVALIAQVPFAIDLVRAYIGLEQVIGLVTYDPSYFTLFGAVVDLGVHLFVLPFVLFGLRHIKVPGYWMFVKWHFLLLFIVLVISSFAGTNCVRIGCFESLSYGSTLMGHVAYLSIVSVLGPLITAYFLRKLYLKIRRSKRTASSYHRTKQQYKTHRVV
jgi:hypothetical protein